MGTEAEEEEEARGEDEALWERLSAMRFLGLGFEIWNFGEDAVEVKLEQQADNK